MKILITFFSVFLATSTLSSQNIIRTELTKDEISYLEKDIYKGFSTVLDEDLESAVKNNLINYEFEIVYKDSVIYRGVINKPSLTDVGKGMFRTSAQFCLNYNAFDSETKLELSENKKLNLLETEKGKKYYCSYDYKLFDRDYKKNLVVNDKLAKKINLKFYKIQYE